MFYELIGWTNISLSTRLSFPKKDVDTFYTSESSLARFTRFDLQFHILRRIGSTGKKWVTPQQSLLSFSLHRFSSFFIFKLIIFAILVLFSETAKFFYPFSVSGKAFSILLRCTRSCPRELVSCSTMIWLIDPLLLDYLLWNLHGQTSSVKLYGLNNFFNPLLHESVTDFREKIYTARCF